MHIHPHQFFNVTLKEGFILIFFSHDINRWLNIEYSFINNVGAVFYCQLVDSYKKACLSGPAGDNSDVKVNYHL
jgi:hypothetical protein